MFYIYLRLRRFECGETRLHTSERIQAFLLKIRRPLTHARCASLAKC